MAEIKKLADMISEDARGFRDVYWCFVLNEPTIVEYLDDQTHCNNCGHEMADEDHVFMFHINKPTSADGSN